jgi:hypothetical protein
MGIASLVKEKSEKSIPVTDSTHSITKAISFSGSNEADHITVQSTIEVTNGTGIHIYHKESFLLLFLQL